MPYYPANDRLLRCQRRPLFENAATVAECIRPDRAQNSRANPTGYSDQFRRKHVLRRPRVHRHQPRPALGPGADLRPLRGGLQSGRGGAIGIRAIEGEGRSLLRLMGGCLLTHYQRPNIFRNALDRVAIVSAFSRNGDINNRKRRD